MSVLDTAVAKQPITIARGSKGEPVDARQHVAPGTGLHSFLGWAGLLIFGPLAAIALAFITYGIALVVWLVAGIMYFGKIKRARAAIRGSALEVGPNQFPEVHARVQEFSARLGLKQPPEVYIIEDNMQNAYAMKFGSRMCVVLIDDVVHGAKSRSDEALDFIVAHELAHHALGHTGLLRSTIRAHYKTLSRLDEISCDAVAHALVADREAALEAMTLLLVGPFLFDRVNLDALRQQAESVIADKHSKRAERSMTHPLLLRRYARLQTL